LFKRSLKLFEPLRNGAQLVFGFSGALTQSQSGHVKQSSPLAGAGMRGEKSLRLSVLYPQNPNLQVLLGG